MTEIDWHFARPELAKFYLDMLFAGGVDRLAFFGRRRIGKTEFMLRDLFPAAEARGAVCLYASMWENLDTPHLGLLRVLRAGVSAAHAQTRGKASVKAKLGDHVEFGIEFDCASHPSPATPVELQEIATLFERLRHEAKKRKTPCLLVLDEIQHLATSARFTAFAAALRTLLDMGKGEVKVIFTGSSWQGLQKLFKDNRAPFYDFANLQVFEPMSHDYVSHLEGIYRQISRQVLPAGELGKVFEATGRNAEITRQVVTNLVLKMGRDVEGEWQSIKDAMQEPDGWCENHWRSLNEADRVVYRMVMRGEDLFSEPALAVYDKAGFSKGATQKALSRLQNRGFISRVGHGDYVTELPVLDEWVQRNDSGRA